METECNNQLEHFKTKHGRKTYLQTYMARQIKKIRGKFI